MKKLIEINNLDKNYGSREILKNVNLTISEGERVAILGDNGVGKTTLMELISQIAQPTKGEIKINLSGNIKSQIGIQFQQGEWSPGLTAGDLLEFFHHLFPKFTLEWEQELAEVFETESLKKIRLVRLSVQQKKRFNTMISLLNHPKIIIFDELTDGLDMESAFKILNFLKKSTIENKQTLLLVSHRPEEVEMLCQRIIILGQQTILFDDSIQNVRKKYGSVQKLMQHFFLEKGTINHA